MHFLFPMLILSPLFPLVIKFNLARKIDAEFCEKIVSQFRFRLDFAKKRGRASFITREASPRLAESVFYYFGIVVLFPSLRLSLRSLPAMRMRLVSLNIMSLANYNAKNRCPAVFSRTNRRYPPEFSKKANSSY